MIVMVFQWGWGASLFGVTDSLPIIAILFGLSMDYEVFLMSRTREEWLHCTDNRKRERRHLAHRSLDPERERERELVGASR